MKQILLTQELKAQLEHGGELAKGRRKSHRPIATRRPMHVVLRTSSYSSLIPHSKFIHEVLSSTGKRFKVKTYQRSINSNHIHLATLAIDRRGFSNFLRVVAGKIASHITKARKGKRLTEKFWANIPYTRIVEWGKSFRTLLGYVRQNTLEAMGIIPYAPRIPQKNKIKKAPNYPNHKKPKPRD